MAFPRTPRRSPPPKLNTLTAFIDFAAAAETRTEYYLMPASTASPLFTVSDALIHAVRGDGAYGMAGEVGEVMRALVAWLD
jgi:streptomycin 6-kinase